MHQYLGLAVYGLAFGSLYLGVLRYPSLALTAVCCMFALDQWGQVASPWLASHQSITNFAVGVLVLQAVLTRRMQRGALQFHFSPDWLMVAALFGYAVVSLAWTPRIDLALPNWQRQAPYILTMVFLAPLLADDATEVRRALRWLVIVGGGLVFAMLFVGNWGYRGLTIDSSAASYETNPLALATFSGMVACAAIFLGVGKSRVLGFVVGLALTGASIMLVIRTESRGQLAALLASLVLLIPVAFPMTRLKSLVALAAAGAGIAAAIYIGLHDYVNLGYGRWSEEGMTENAEGRLEMAQVLLAAWQSSPLTMILGLGNSAAFDPKILGFYPHITPLEILGEEGLVGIGLYLGILGMAARNFLLGRRLARHDETRLPLVAALAAMVVFTLLASWKEGSLLGNSFFFFTITVFSALVRALASQQPAAPAPFKAAAVWRPANLMD